MTRRIVGIIRRVNGASGFEGYLEGLQSRDGPYAPTRDQAKRDYQTFHQVGGPYQASLHPL